MSRMFRVVAALSLVGGLLTGQIGGAHAGGGQTIHAHRVIGNLDTPVAFTIAPNGRIWFVEKATGRIRIYNPATGGTPVFFRVSHINGEGERGMLGIALHPSFPAKPFVYVYATRMVSGHLRNQILRFTDVAGSGRHQRVIFSAPASAAAYHNGGRILFGPDGMLYAIVGDGHDSSNAQDLSSNNRGKVLRMTPNGGVPSDDPFANKLIFSYGNRNSFGFTFDPQTGSLWETENGPECNDEVNLITPGDNFGWGPSESCSGTHPDDTNNSGTNPVFPTLFFQSTIGITGDAFCDECHLNAASEGSLFFGAVNNTNVYRVELNSARDDTQNGTLATPITNLSGPVLSMEVGPNGSIYFSDFGAIYKLVYS